KGVRASIRAVDPSLRNAYAHNWFLGLQRQVGFGFVLEADYIGSAGHRLYNQNNINRFAGDLLDSRFDGFNSSFAAVNLISGTANSVYHGGSFQVRRQFAKGFTLHSSFTFSKAIDESDDLTNVSNFQDASNRRAGRRKRRRSRPQCRQRPRLRADRYFAFEEVPANRARLHAAPG